MLKDFSWLPLDEAVEYFGYKHLESLRQRIRQLRKQGYVVDIGKVPAPYEVGDEEATDKIILYWPNHNTSMIRSDAPRELLNPKLGKRARKPTNEK